MDNKQYQKEYYQRTKKAKIKKRIMGSILCPDIKDYPFCESLGGPFSFYLDRRNGKGFRSIINYGKKLKTIMDSKLTNILFQEGEDGLYSSVKYSWLVLLTRKELTAIFGIKRWLFDHYLEKGILRQFMGKDLYLINPYYPFSIAKTDQILVKIFIDELPFAIYYFRSGLDLAGAVTVEEKALASAFILMGENDYDWKIEYSYRGACKTISRNREQRESLMDSE